jgi:hypothetical protein
MMRLQSMIVMQNRENQAPFKNMVNTIQKLQLQSPDFHKALIASIPRGFRIRGGCQPHYNRNQFKNVEFMNPICLADKVAKHIYEHRNEEKKVPRRDHPIMVGVARAQFIIYVHFVQF